MSEKTQCSLGRIKYEFFHGYVLTCAYWIPVGCYHEGGKPSSSHGGSRMFKIEHTEPPALTQAFAEASRRHGHYGNTRGAAHEQRFVEIIAARFRARWFRSVRRAKKYEDQNGIDAVIQTTIGPLYVQVKSSPGSARRFYRKKRRARIAVILVRETLSDNDIAEAATKKLHALFHHINRLRNNRRAKIKNAVS